MPTFQCKGCSATPERTGHYQKWCADCALRANQARWAAQAAKSRDKTRARATKYRCENKERLNADTRARRAAQDETAKARERELAKAPARRRARKEWESKNLEQRAAYARDYRAKYPEKEAAKTRKYALLNPEKVKARGHKRRAAKRGLEGSWKDSDWEGIKAKYGHRCPSCGSLEELTVDHIVPTSWGGNNWPWNLAVLCGSCNKAKNDVWLIEFLPWNGERRVVFSEYIGRRPAKRKR